MKSFLSLALALAFYGVCLGQGGELTLGPSCEAAATGSAANGVNAGCGNPRCTRCRSKICVNVPETICIKRPCGQEQPRELTPPSKPREAEGPQEQPVGGLQETGAYIAPPRTGTTRGATNFRGVEGGGITFPALHLRLPSIELPHCFHGRSAARMNIDSAVAPWESHGFVNTGAATGNTALQQRIATLEDELKKRDAQSRDANAGDASDRAAKDREAAADYAKKLQEYEDLLKKCEEEQQRLRDCIQNCLEAHKGRGANDRSIQKPAGKSPQQAPHMSPQQAPVGPPPQPDPAQHRFRRLPTVEYQEAPASYISEPAYSEPRRLVISEPQPIQEPRTPSAKITGLRPVR